jgi:hypothetical protein
MREIDRIRKLKPEELAPMLVRSVTEPDYDEDWDGDMVQCGELYFYVTPDECQFWDWQDAIDHTVKLLLSEVGTIIYERGY